ncbi:MAG TPA: hypothetical protein VNB29_10050, partial [Chthoniobacterales bacterium]|nr:hypothetical protein [Chthoniobacterales bacterium]
RLSTLFANDTNQANATVTFAGVSTNGVPITQSGDFLIYHTPGGQTGDDAFTYTLTDAIGIASTATVNVIKVDPLPVVTVAPRAGGGVVLTLKGQPVTTYRIHKSSDLVNWSVIQIEEPSEWNGFSGTEITTDGDGNATYEDTTSPDAGTASFYRAERY